MLWIDVHNSIILKKQYKITKNMRLTSVLSSLLQVKTFRLKAFLDGRIEMGISWLEKGMRWSYSQELIWSFFHSLSDSCYLFCRCCCCCLLFVCLLLFVVCYLFVCYLFVCLLLLLLFFCRFERLRNTKYHLKRDNFLSTQIIKENDRA